MKTNLIKLSLLTATLLFASTGYAQQRKYSSCSESKRIQEPQGSQGFFLNENCSTAYVLPPVSGKINVAKYFQSVDDQTCKSYTSIIDTINERIQDIGRLRKDLKEAEGGLAKKYTEIKRLKESCSPQERALDSVDQAKALIDSQLEVITLRLNNKLQERESCLIAEKGDCDKDKYDIEDLEEKRDLTLEKKVRLDGQRRVLEVNLSSCAKQRDTKIAHIQEGDQEFKRIRDELTEENKKLTDYLDNEATKLTKKPGAIMTMSFLSQQNDMVQKFKAQNKAVEIDFVPMPIDSAAISFRWVEDGNLAGLPVIMKSNIHGLPSTEGDRASLESLLITQGSGAANNIFGQAVSGDMVINMLAACQLQQRVGHMDEAQATAHLAGIVLPTVTYRYSVQVDRRISIKYREDHLFQQIKKQTSSNGFFRSSTVSSLTQTSEAEKWVDITIESQDADHEFVNSTEMMMDLRRELVDSALMRAARGYLTSEQVELREPGKSGAEQGSATLKKCPHLYCQYAAIALDLGSAFFGGSTAEANMTKVVKASASERLTDKKMVPEFGTQTFSVKH